MPRKSKPTPAQPATPLSLPGSAANPRQAAAVILGQVADGRHTLDQALDRFHSRGTQLSFRDQRLFQALVFGVLRQQGRLDWIIDQISRTPVKKMDPPVRTILRLGLFQIGFMDRIPVSAAVNTSVEIAKGLAPPWVVKLINAVLRRAAREWDQIPLPDPVKDPVKFLSVKYSHPAWMVRRWCNRWGRQAAQDHCAANNAISPLGLRTNTLRTDRNTLVEALTGEVGSLSIGRFSPWHLNVTAPRTPLATILPFKNGWFQVQDEAAQLAARIADPRPGEQILDACAGLGGKTGALAQLMKNRGTILAIDRSAAKLNQLEKAMQRLGITNVATQAVDLMAPHPFENSDYRFDRILLDAPCSGLGVIRRNPDTKWRARPQDLPRHGKRQYRLLKRIAPLVKPGGYLVYVVCSTEPEENGGVIERFLEKHPKFQQESILADERKKKYGRGEKKKAPSTGPRAQALHLLTKDGFLQTRPHVQGLDGFFVARLRRHR